MLGISDAGGVSPAMIGIGLGAGVLVMLILRSLRGGGGGAPIASTTKAVGKGGNYTVLMHTATAVFPLRVWAGATMFLTRDYGGYFEFPGHAVHWRSGHLWKRPASDREAEILRKRRTTYGLRTLDARPLLFQAGAEKGYVGRKAGQEDFRRVEDATARIAQEEGIREGTPDEQTAKMLQRVAFMSFVVAGLVWASLFGFNLYKGAIS